VNSEAAGGSFVQAGQVGHGRAGVGGAVAAGVAGRRARALGKLVERHWPFLLAQAGGRLPLGLRRAANEEDVAQEVVWALHEGLGQGRWQRLANRQDLVALLNLLTERRAVNQLKRELTRKRGGGAVLNEAALAGAGDSGESGLRGVALDPALPPPEQVLQDEWCRHCLERLSAELRPVAELLLAGCTVPDIARALGYSQRTVARRIALVRGRWLRLLAEAENPPAPRSPYSAIGFGSIVARDRPTSSSACS
jgi:DNA-directed RNA polymerase specialized sigma24 family protein